MKCSNCNAELKEGALFCGKCGTKQMPQMFSSDVTTQETQSFNQAPVYNSQSVPVYHPQEYSGYTPQQESAILPTSNEGMPPRKDGGNKGLIAIIIVLAILVLGMLGFGAYMMFINEDSPIYLLSDSKEDVDDDEAEEEDEGEEEDEAEPEDEEDTASAEDENTDDQTSEEEEDEEWKAPEVIDGLEPTEDGSTPLEYFNPKEHSYEIVKDDVSWVEASTLCEKRGGNLASVICFEEIELIDAYLREQGIDKMEEPYMIWLGAYINDEGMYAWTTGEGVGVSNWDSGEPSGVDAEGKPEEFIVMYYNKDVDAWKWKDVKGDIRDEYAGRIAYLCEWQKVVKE